VKVLQLLADPLPDGRVTLSWRTPPEPAFRGARVVRRERRFGVVADLDSPAEVFRDDVTPAGAAAQFVDGPLQGETVYYYTVFAYDAAGRLFPEFASALAAAPYGMEDHLYRSLPEIYQLFDRARRAHMPATTPDPRAGGSLRRLVEIIGQPFDLLRSFAGAMRDFHDVDRVDGALLPLLAQWIGQPSDITLDLERQRNEVRYAPQYYRTVGVLANLRAAINRFVNWDARIKEFVHNVFLVSHPEQLTIWELSRTGTEWTAPRTVNLDIAFDGRAVPLETSDGRTWLVYHARRSAPAGPAGDPATGPGHDRWHLFAKIEDRDEAQASIQLTGGPVIRKHPSAVGRPDGSVWIFYGRYSDVSGRQVPKIGLQVVAAGRAALPAHVTGATRGPFALVDGDVFDITIGAGASSVVRRVTVRHEHLPGLASASAVDVARLLDRELPGVNVDATDDGRIRFASIDTGTPALLTIAASTLATKIGLAPGVFSGSDATSAELAGSSAPFNLSDGATLSIRVDDDSPRSVHFRATEFVDITNATVAEVVGAIERQIPGIASAAGAALRLRSSRAGARSFLMIDADSSTASAALGLGTPVPSAAAAVDENEPSSCVDSNGDIWLFWKSRRTGFWKIWYNRCAGGAWDTPKPLTTGDLADHEPFALFDPAAGGRLWVFWTRKKANGRHNVFSRTTTNLNFPVLADADWTERENTPAPADADNRDAAAALGAAAGDVELYFASNRADGWNVWTRTVAAATAGAESPVTVGQVTRRHPAVLRLASGTVRLFLRSNDSQRYSSAVYPSAITLDARYSGSTAADFRNPTKLSLRGQLQDLQRYTSDTRRDPPDAEKKKQAGLFAREVVGVYLTPDTDDQAFVLRQRRLFANALRRVLPIQVRIAFLIDQANSEVIYSYSRPDVQPPITIGERMIDTILSEVISAGSDSHSDAAPGVRFLRTWTPGDPTVLPDLTAAPIDLSSRLYSRLFDEGA
jgi:phage tail-like protein